jgi:hypothetical protein
MIEGIYCLAMCNVSNENRVGKITNHDMLEGSHCLSMCNVGNETLVPVKQYVSP